MICKPRWLAGCWGACGAVEGRSRRSIPCSQLAQRPIAAEIRPGAVPPLPRSLSFHAAWALAVTQHRRRQRATAPAWCAVRVGGAEGVWGDRGGVCGGLGACGTKAVLGRARRCMLVLRAGATSGCLAPPPSPARLTPPWGVRPGALLVCTRAPGRSCTQRGVGRAGCSSAMRGVRRGTAAGARHARRGAGWRRGARGWIPPQFQSRTIPNNMRRMH